MATKTIKIRIKDSTSCKKLNQMARAVNFVWNHLNETSSTPSETFPLVVSLRSSKTL